MPRCFGDGDPLYEAYHDDEWGVPVTDEQALFERIALESFQSGLAWITILRKRDAFRAAFAGFDIAAVAAFGDEDVERLLADNTRALEWLGWSPTVSLREGLQRTSDWVAADLDAVDTPGYSV